MAFKSKRVIVPTKAGNTVEWFGIRWTLQTSERDAAMCCFGQYDHCVEKGCSWSRAALFWWIVDYYWGAHAKKKFIRHPWAERMVDAVCDYDNVAISGCASSGKSDFGAMWALINWMCMPDKTKVLITSTTMKDAQKRIWGSVRDYYYGATDPDGTVNVLPGKYLHSFGQIRTNVFASDDTGSDKSGIELIPAGQSKETQAIGRLIGIKADHRLIVVADELPELGMSLLEASESNLSMNPRYQFIGLGNHVSWLDPFGVLCTPKEGIKSVTVDDDEWETEKGFCIHLDGLKSPNFDQERDIWPIYGRKQKAKHERLNANSIGFWRMCRSFPPQDAEAGQIYSEIELITTGCVSKPHFKGGVVKLAFLDPAFTTGGDRCQGRIGLLGRTTDNRMVLSPLISRVFTEDVTNKSVPMNFQMARAFIAWCKENGVDPENVGLDSTGAGIPFAEIVMQEWSSRILRVSFNGKPSSLTISPTDPQTGEDAYVNRVSELWYQGIHYVRGSQLMNLDRDTVKEMVCRRYITSKRGSNLKIQVETKEEMVKRLKFSPDMADALFGMLELARQRHGFFPEAFGRALKAEEAQELVEQTKYVPELQEFDCLVNDYADPERF